MFCDKKEYINLIIEDDGVGLPKEIDIQKLESMGLRLVSNTITNDLGGSLEIAPDIMVIRRLYAIETWIAVTGLSVYIALIYGDRIKAALTRKINPYKVNISCFKKE